MAAMGGATVTDAGKCALWDGSTCTVEQDHYSAKVSRHIGTRCVWDETWTRRPGRITPAAWVEAVVAEMRDDPRAFYRWNITT